MSKTSAGKPQPKLFPLTYKVGHGPAEAHRRARIEFGGIERAKVAPWAKATFLETLLQVTQMRLRSQERKRFNSVILLQECFAGSP